MSELFSLKGRLALVTGSGSGIGFALAQGLAGHGARIVVNGRSANKVESAVAALRDRGFSAESCFFDVTNAAEVESEIERIERESGPIDIVVNNAGVQFRKPLEEFPDDMWQQILQTNVTGVFNVSRAVARRMIPRRRGKIINIASVMSELARATITPYTATKGAVRTMTRGMCAEWAKHGIQVNAIAPGFFRTELNQALTQDPDFNAWLEKRTPAGRWGEVEELVGAAVFLASNASTFVNGHTLYVDGGMTVTV